MHPDADLTLYADGVATASSGGAPLPQWSHTGGELQ